jgi:hypothetical protein
MRREPQGRRPRHTRATRGGGGGGGGSGSGGGRLLGARCGARDRGWRADGPLDGWLFGVTQGQTGEVQGSGYSPATWPSLAREASKQTVAAVHATHVVEGSFRQKVVVLSALDKRALDTARVRHGASVNKAHINLYFLSRRINSVSV